jgi:hypothetical protein
MRHHRLIFNLTLSVGAALCVIAWAPVVTSGKGPFRTLIVGGGPDLEHNQVAIESNVRYLQRIMPNDSPTRVLFTDGNPDSKNIQCEGDDKKIFYKKPEIGKIDGPSDMLAINSELAAIAVDAQQKPKSPILLYFTGHGSPNARSRYNNNSYDLWDRKEYTVKDFANTLKVFPKEAPITLVMVECFSGAFGNLLFQDGDPKGDLADVNLCGFFASVAQRPAAGCTPELKEANYRDFTSYFFAALSGTDRLGNKVFGADYNHDGKVTMNEAFAYSLIHDDSIDTPVCTSDVFLRRFITTPDNEIMSTPLSKVRQWASPSQLAALDALGAYLKLQDEDALTLAYDEFMHMNQDSDDPRNVHTIRFVRLGKSIVLGHMLMAGDDKMLKDRYQALLKLESTNPIR